MGMCSPEGALTRCSKCLGVLAGAACVLFFFVWSIMGAVRMRDGLGPDEFFRVASIVTLVFTFLMSYGIIAFIFLICICACCCVACAPCMQAVLQKIVPGEAGAKLLELTGRQAQISSYNRVD